jgi:predicted TIM-barrel fold metal-dependent hydrolase
MAHLLVQELGPSALLWGSDWPCTNFEAWADYQALYASLGFTVYGVLPNAVRVEGRDYAKIHMVCRLR